MNVSTGSFSQARAMTGNRAAAAAHTLDLVVSLAFITLLFAMIYKFVPDVRIAWSDVWIGAATASALFSVAENF